MLARDEDPVTFMLAKPDPDRVFLFVCKYDQWPKISALLHAQEKDAAEARSD